MDVIPLLSSLHTGVSTSPINTLMDWQGFHCLLYGWLGLMVHHTPTKSRVRSVPFFFYPYWSIMCRDMWPVWMWSPCWLLVQWCVNPTNALVDGLIGVTIPIWMVGAQSTSHPIQGRWWKCPSFYLSAHGTSFGCCIASMDVILFLVNCTMVDQLHPCIYWWVERNVNTYMNGCSS